MFLNHRPLLVLLLFLASNPVDVYSRIVYSEAEKEISGCNNRTGPIALDLNPLHILCPVCSLLQFLLGGVLGLLGGGLIEQIGILVCAIGLKGAIHLPFVPNIICTVVFELIFMITKKAGSGICPLLLLCPMPHKKATPTKTPILSAEDEYEQRVLEIIENRENSANLAPQYEYLYQDLMSLLPNMKILEGTEVEEAARHVLRNFVAAIQYHSEHREEYLKSKELFPGRHFTKLPSQ